MIHQHNAGPDPVDDVESGIGELGTALLVGGLPDDGLQSRHPRAAHHDDVDVPGDQQALRGGLQPLSDDGRVDAVVEVGRVQPGGLDAGEPGVGIAVVVALDAQERPYALGQVVLPEFSCRDDAPLLVEPEQR